MVKYSDLPMDFADACLVLLGEKLNTVSTVVDYCIETLMYIG